MGSRMKRVCACTLDRLWRKKVVSLHFKSSLYAISHHTCHNRLLILEDNSVPALEVRAPNPLNDKHPLSPEQPVLTMIGSRMDLTPAWNDGGIVLLDEFKILPTYLTARELLVKWWDFSFPHACLGCLLRGGKYDVGLLRTCASCGLSYLYIGYWRPCY